MLATSNRKVKSFGILAFITILIMGSASAEIPNSKNLTLARDSEPTSHYLKGYIRGQFGLHHIVGSRDSKNNLCFGYGSYDPDHLITLKQRFPSLVLHVKSKYPDTTIVVRGPDQKLYCADDSLNGKAAQLELKNLKLGTYQVWVGAFDQGDSFRYMLKVNQTDTVSQN